MAVVSMKQLLEAGVHFGHQTRRWNPKMAEYIYCERNGIYIIDLQKTVKKLEEAYNFVRTLAENGQTILFVGTKKQAADAVKEEASRVGMYYVNARWLGGMLTNFKTMRTRIDRLAQLKKMQEDGTFDMLPKKEVMKHLGEMEKLEKYLGGVKDMKKLPGALFVVDPRKERNDLELLVDEIRVFEDRLELKLQPDVDSILQCSTMERTINFPDGTGDISSISIVQSAKQRPDKVFRANVICNGSPSRIRMVRRISLGMTTRPRSSIRRTIPVAFIYEIPPVKANFTSVVSAPREMNMHEVPLTIFCRQSTARGIAAIKRPPVVRPEVLHFFAFLQSAYFTARPAYPPAACAPASEWRRPP